MGYGGGDQRRQRHRCGRSPVAPGVGGIHQHVVRGAWYEVGQCLPPGCRRDAVVHPGTLPGHPVFDDVIRNRAARRGRDEVDGDRGRGGRRAHADPRDLARGDHGVRGGRRDRGPGVRRSRAERGLQGGARKGMLSVRDRRVIDRVGIVPVVGIYGVVGLDVVRHAVDEIGVVAAARAAVRHEPLPGAPLGDADRLAMELREAGQPVEPRDRGERGVPSDHGIGVGRVVVARVDVHADDVDDIVPRVDRVRDRLGRPPRDAPVKGEVGARDGAHQRDDVPVGRDITGRVVARRPRHPVPVEFPA